VGVRGKSCLLGNDKEWGELFGDKERGKRGATGELPRDLEGETPGRFTRGGHKGRA